MALLLDAGALIAVEKRERRLRARLQVAQREGLPVRTGATALAQVWRSGSRQANLARVLAGIDVLPLDEAHARRAGELLGVTGTSDVVDAHMAVLARRGDEVLTSDPEDLRRLLFERRIGVRVVGV
jgi:predicted nucleic acid-binding protein